MNQWDGIKEQFLVNLKPKKINLLETSTARSESLFSKIKKIFSPKMDIALFLKEIINFTKYRREKYADEIKYSYIRLKRISFPLIPLFMYDVITIKAMKILSKHIKTVRHKAFYVDKCCNFAVWSGLPCFHMIITLDNKHDILKIVHPRWFRKTNPIFTSKLINPITEISTEIEQYDINPEVKMNGEDEDYVKIEETLLSDDI